MTALGDILRTLGPDTPTAIPANWLQGRTAYGGLSAAMALDVVLKSQGGGLPPLRSAQLSFIGPVTEGARFRAELLRKGRSVTQVGAEIRVDDSPALRASFVFAAARGSQIEHLRVERPEVAPPEHCAEPAAGELLPGHFPNFDVRFIGAARPLSGTATPELLAWVRLREPAGVPPEVAMLALGDCLPPASMAVFPAMAPISSMNWSVDLQRPAAADGWFLQRSRSLAAAQGYSWQVMEMWDRDGHLVLLGTQTVAIFV